MKYLIISSLLVLGSCSITPEIIPKYRTDSPMAMKLKDGITDPGLKESSWAWLYWYAPISAIALAWAYKEFIVKPQVKADS